MHLVCQVHNYWCSCLVFADSYNVIYSFSWTIIFFTNSLQPMMDNLFSCTLVQGRKAGGRAKTWCMLFFKNYFLRIIRFKYENRVRPSEGFWAPTPPQKWMYQIQPFGATVWGPTQLLRAARPSRAQGFSKFLFASQYKYSWHVDVYSIQNCLPDP